LLYYFHIIEANHWPTVHSNPLNCHSVWGRLGNTVF